MTHLYPDAICAAIHVQAGVNRSGVVVAAATMIQLGLPVVEAVEHCRQRRGPMLWNKGFQVQIKMERPLL